MSLINEMIDFVFLGVSALGLNWTISIAYFAEVGEGKFCLGA